MKWLWSPRGLFALGFAVLAATNIAVLAGVAYNRSGTPETLITLSERELPLPYYRNEENSGLALHLDWRVLGAEENDASYRRWGYPAWLTADKLAALGFAIDAAPEADPHGSRPRAPLPKEVFIVLEKDGPAYREAIRRAEQTLAREEKRLDADRADKQRQEAVDNAAKSLEKERIAASRLFAVDAGLDPGRLRETYADRTRFIIARGLVKPVYDYEKKRRRVRGSIQRLSVETIHVPLKHREILDALRPSVAPGRPPSNRRAMKSNWPTDTASSPGLCPSKRLNEKQHLTPALPREMNRVCLLAVRTRPLA